MQAPFRLVVAVGALFSVVGGTHAQPTPYYNPANSASASGLTTGHALFKTIGCPGRGLLDAPCEVPAPTAPKPAPAKPAAVAAPPSDRDGDGVPDERDRCPDTPAGVKVDAFGCELDSDGDGVVDRLDPCPGTPAGARVDARGCELDSDRDGVVDRLDSCPGTPAGAGVDARGCELDSDGDGVVDRLDQCANTPTGTRVDARGCPPAARIELRGVHFDNDMATLRPDAVFILESAVATLQRNRNLKVEIAGHTDDVGTVEHNLDLSQRRAQAVMDYFISRGISAENLTAQGYGDRQPIAGNETPEGRASNRRVELRVMN